MQIRVCGESAWMLPDCFGRVDGPRLCRQRLPDQSPIPVKGMAEDEVEPAVDESQSDAEGDTS